MNNKKIFSNILNILILFLVINLVYNYFFKQPDVSTNKEPITIESTKQEFSMGDLIQAEVKNNTNSPITISNICPQAPLEVLYKQNGNWLAKPTSLPPSVNINCDGTQDIIIKANDKHTLDFKYWNHALFSELGTYKVRTAVKLEQPILADHQDFIGQYAINHPQTNTQQTSTTLQSTQTTTQVTTETASINNDTLQTAINEAAKTNPALLTKTIESNEFEMKPQGWFGAIWNAVFYQPIYNTLIFIISILPSHNLGFAIILLTLLIRTVLLIPSQNALKSQRKLQEVQPKLNKLKEKYKDNQEMLAKESMAIWKEHKVNPFGSCLPLFIQLPILIALYWVVQNGLNADNAYLLYGSLKEFQFHSIQTVFLGILDLTKVNQIVLPLLVGGLQFLQMKLAIVRNKNKASKDEVKLEKMDKKQGGGEMDIANNMMLYVMPGMIALFTASAPAGVGLYWCISTLYGIGQQLVVNYQSDQKNTQVKVLN